MWSVLDLLFPPRADERVLREVTLDQFLELVSPKVVPATRPPAVALLPFSDERVKAAIHEAKYHRSDYAFKLLGAALAEYLLDLDLELAKPRFVIVPVPLGQKRLRDRGYNQVEEMAKRATTLFNGAVDAMILARTRETESQVGQAREKREANMRGAFRVPEAAIEKIDPAFTYIVVDDVLTTGATLQAAIEALKDVGATNIIPIALAH